jgi:hypothetical protein
MLPFYGLKTNALEARIRSELAKLEEHEDICLNTFFHENAPNSLEGAYVFSDERGYHYVYSERGSESIHKITDSLFEICFWRIYPIVSTRSFRFEEEHRVKGVDQRRLAFKRRIELLDCIGANYRKRGEIDIDETLENYPYNDDRV